MNLRTTVIPAAMTVAALLPASGAQAGGLFISEFATPSMGTADAGAQAWADNASTAWHNPAGMTRLERSEVMLGVGLADSKVVFEDASDTPFPGNDAGDAGSTAPIGSLNGVLKINDRLAAGLSAGGITGASLDYNPGWSGRFQVEETSLLVAGITPSVAYAVTDWLSLAAGTTLVYGSLDLQVEAPVPTGGVKADIDGADDTDVTYSLSGMITASERTRFGIIYNSEAELDLSGDVELRPTPVAINTDLTFVFPQYVKAGVYHDLTDKIALLGSVRWEDWSSFNDIPVSTERADASIPTKWRDTYGFSLGVHYRFDQKLLLQAGFGFDTSPVSDANRRADLPIDRQYRYSAGLQYQLTDKLTLGGSIVYADLGDADIDGAVLKGSYDTNRVWFFGANLGYKF